MLMKQKQRSYEVVSDPALSQPEEFDGITCGHCGVNRRVEPMTVRGNVLTNKDGQVALGAICGVCGKQICAHCVGKGCTPMERAIERWERRREYEELFDGS
jgi:hypothetical protein